MLTKAGNVFSIGYSYLKSSITGDPDIFGMPLSIGTELTNKCNLRCPECSSGSGEMTRPRGFMEIDLFTKIVKELKPYLYNISLYFQGEPMLHPHFFSFPPICGDISTIVSTNGHFLSKENAEKTVESGLRKIIISLDGKDQETYSSYRKNGNIEKVFEGITNLSAARNKLRSGLKIEIQFLVNKLNEHQIPDIRKFAVSVKAALRLKSMQVIHKDKAEYWMPVNEEFRRYHLKDNEYSIKNSLPNRCARLWINPVITWDGKVLPCCFDKNADYIMGDLNVDSFSDIWHGPKYQAFRKSVLSGRNMIDICTDCTSGLKGIRY